MELVHFRVNVPVGENKIGPAVVVEVKEHRSPAEILRVQSEPGGKGHVGENSIAVITVQGGRVIGKISLENIQPSVAVYIC